SIERIGHSIKAEKTIDAEYQRIMDMEIQHWREVRKRIIWSSRVVALKPLRFQLCEVYDAIMQIIEDDRDAETKVKARGLADSIKNYKFISGSILSVENESDINANDLQEKLRDASRMLPYSMKPLDVLNYLCQNNIITLYSNTVVFLRILLTLPASVASGERSFPKLKLIKQYLRSSISQTKLRNLSLISIESTLAATLGYTYLINKFAKVKVRRVQL
ncbi:hypothetical protein ILUMI_01440, partial [Ignelater luminosus]